MLQIENQTISIFGYDKDGNFVGMKRYGSSNNLADDFGYSYFSGTNRLQTIGEGLTAYNYTYDKNGNMTSDQLNRTGSIKYDHRNLMTDVRAIKTENGVFGPEDITYWTVYRYDEDCQSQFSETAQPFLRQVTVYVNFAINTPAANLTLSLI